MTKQIKRKSHTAGFKFKVAVAMMKGEKTTAEICSEYSIASCQAFTWKKELLERGFDVFDSKSSRMTQKRIWTDFTQQSVVLRLKTIFYRKCSESNRRKKAQRTFEEPLKEA